MALLLASNVTHYKAAIALVLIQLFVVVVFGLGPEIIKLFSYSTNHKVSAAH